MRTRGRAYPWGNLYNSRLANHGRLGLERVDDRDGFEELAPVGSFVSGRTPDGFLDLAGNAAETKRIFLGPELPRFEAMAETAESLAQYEVDEAISADQAFDDARDDAKRTLITVALGAGIVILLLLVTASDVARLALEGECRSQGEPPRRKPDEPRRDDRP